MCNEGLGIQANKKVGKLRRNDSLTWTKKSKALYQSLKSVFLQADYEGRD